MPCRTPEPFCCLAGRGEGGHRARHVQQRGAAWARKRAARPGGSAALHAGRHHRRELHRAHVDRAGASARPAA